MRIVKLYCSERVRHDGRGVGVVREQGRRGSGAGEQVAVEALALAWRQQVVRHSDEARGARERAVGGGDAARACRKRARETAQNGGELPAEVRAVCEAACAAWCVQERKGGIAGVRECGRVCEGGGVRVYGCAIIQHPAEDDHAESEAGATIAVVRDAEREAQHHARPATGGNE
jgi:hypothetical protein